MRICAAVLTTTTVFASAGSFPGRLPQSAMAAAPTGDSVVVAVFEGRTPCGQIATRFTGFPSQNCEKIKWQLTLFRNRQSQLPSAFLYEGTRTSRRGSWVIQRGTPTDADAEVYRLTTKPTGETLHLLNIGGQVLLLLDDQLRVVVGDASWSYTLNRTDRGL
jgi:hypothetical protein